MEALETRRLLTGALLDTVTINPLNNTPVSSSLTMATGDPYLLYASGEAVVDYHSGDYRLGDAKYQQEPVPNTSTWTQYTNTNTSGLGAGLKIGVQSPDFGGGNLSWTGVTSPPSEYTSIVTPTTSTVGFYYNDTSTSTTVIMPLCQAIPWMSQFIPILMLKLPTATTRATAPMRRLRLFHLPPP